VTGVADGGALAGRRVVELASEHGAFAGKILADLGAEVIVVEPRGGHPSRWFGPFEGGVPDPERCLWWWHYNTGKLSVTLDLDDDGDGARFRSLVASADVVIEGERPGSLAGLGLDYADLAPEQPGLVWVSITPFGRSTSRAAEPATDLTIAAGAGPAWSCGYDDHSLPPVRPAADQAYQTAALWAVMGAMTALYVQDTQGIGQFVDVSMHAASNVTTEAATYEWLVAQQTVQRQTFRHAAVRETPPRLMDSSDGGFVIGALPRTAREFGALHDWILSLGIEAEMDEVFFLPLGVERGGVLLNEVATDVEAAAIYRAGADGLRLVASHLPAKQFFLEAQRRGIAAGVVYAPEDLIEDEHFAARGFPVPVRHEDLGRAFLYPGPPFQASGTPWRVQGRAPHAGEHQDQVIGP
jgi:crotonobetainyl-CoA:carnitine CoA-transferase CaiB-like acyl-CoA transferase